MKGLIISPVSQKLLDVMAKDRQLTRKVGVSVAASELEGEVVADDVAFFATCGWSLTASAKTVRVELTSPDAVLKASKNSELATFTLELLAEFPWKVVTRNENKYVKEGKRWKAAVTRDRGVTSVPAGVIASDPAIFNFPSFCSYVLSGPRSNDTFQLVLSKEGQVTYHSTSDLRLVLDLAEGNLEGASLVSSGVRATFLSEKMARMALDSLTSRVVNVSGLGARRLRFGKGFLELTCETACDWEPPRFPPGTEVIAAEDPHLDTPQDPADFMDVIAEDASEEVFVKAWEVAVARTVPTGSFGLTTYSVPLPEGTTDLNLSGNLFEELDLTGLPASVRRVECTHNPLTKLSNVPATVRVLECHSNSLVELPESLPGVEVLWCYRNRLTRLPSLPKVTEVMSFDNLLEVVEPSSLPRCKIAWLNGNPLSPEARALVRAVRWLC